MKYLPIETAPNEQTPMFVVRAFNVTFGLIKGYTTDPYCVYRGTSGEFVRWPHDFPPTHWCQLPDEPTDVTVVD